MNIVENIRMPSEIVVNTFDQWKAKNLPSVSVDIDQNDEQSIHLNQISSSEIGMGYASICLKKLCSLCDAHGVVIIAAVYGGFSKEVPTFGNASANLLAWYKRYGFEQIDDSETIWRTPKSV